MIGRIKMIPIFLIFILHISCNVDDRSKRFSLLQSDRTGVNFQNLVKETERFNVFDYGYMYNGGGVSVGDFNNDSLPDIYFTGNMVGSHLYINQGDFKFKEIAKEAGVFAEGLWNTGTTMADVNGDGFLDIYVCRSAAKDPKKRRNLLFINNGDLTFTEKAEEYGINDSGYSTQAAFFDYDRDGDLDLYVLNHSTQEYAGFSQITASLKKKYNKAFSDKMFRNDNGKFTDVSDRSGLISNVLGFGLGVSVSDLNNDGWLDLYISNDYNEQDYLYINSQNGTFKESLEEYVGHTSMFSMGSDIADINNDGFMDIMTLDMLPEGNYRQKMVFGPDNYDKYNLLVTSGFYNQSMRNMLQLNNQGQSFSEIGQFSGISNTDWSWAPLFADFDLDGNKDLFITNGYKRDYTNMDFMNYAVQEKLNENKTGKKTAILDLLGEIPSTIEENYTYHNNGDLTFSKVNESWGLDQKSLSNGAAYADFDNDGDLDLVVNNIDEAAFIYRNNTELFDENNYLKVRLNGNGKNTFGIGAKIKLRIGDEIMVQEMIPTRGYQSSVDLSMVFGLGKSTAVDELAVLWPDGQTQKLYNLEVNKTLTLKQEDSHKEVLINYVDTNDTYFSDISKDSMATFRHRENNYVDFNREKLLPHKLSTQGPRMAKGDVNNDGLEDFYIGGAKGSSGKLFLQQKSGEFRLESKNVFLDDKNSEDLEALFFDADLDGDLDLYAVSGGNEYDINSPELQDRLYFNDGDGNFRQNKGSLPEMLTSSSCVAAMDYDNDGDVDLFVGGGAVPGRYPFAERSYLLENNGYGKFVDITSEVNTKLINPGMVKGALWSDFNGDGNPDLLIVGEFMKILAFKNLDGKLSELTSLSGLSETEGWWNTIREGDFDGDGDMDYILGNLGFNSQLKASVREPVEMYAKDFDNNGSIDPILCSYINGHSYPVFSKDDLLGQLSILKSRYIKYSEYANEQITDIFSEDDLKGVTKFKAVNFASSYVENLGNSQFVLKALPSEAQFSPIYAVETGDFNADGYPDLILAGNFFGNRVKFGRSDANNGLLLLGNGSGEFRAVDNKTSGLNVHGEVRDIITLPLMHESKIVVFAKNDLEIQIFKVNAQQ
ncbi:VCBS repeat-containing protein [Arenibacter sp. F26102]|uniref:VCBS repeat-containing protein n=1 Tax=Arenibacter sp. F26102 TaxID=2926416 RepID=UPI001FF25D0A|nr:VCBS repeat-containing protein [Arenibacter sp. F26102]MCK0144940.1 VCBS repeat-containing protein [Arenibacter sp. F26102]